MTIMMMMMIVMMMITTTITKQGILKIADYIEKLMHIIDAQ